MAKAKWCRTCRTWFLVNDGCGCGYEGEDFNKHLRTAELNRHLYGMAQTVKKEHTDSAHFVAQAKREAKRVAGS